MVKWASLLTQTDRPSMTLKIRGKTFSGLVDSGTDISLIASQHWPHTWPTKATFSSGEGVGFVTAEEIRQSSVPLKCEGPEGLEGIIQPFILNTSINLWGRDLLQQWGAELIIAPNRPVNQIMTKMGYKPGQGLGRQHPGIKEPIIAQGQTHRAGLGYPFL
ncbi:endogenous retrovirus group K member 7 Pro protein-like [Eumetopias jubatus]|uniref:endogenous retrovirus group K member 7 Pro protein-like n=1 Tax=Eumetopias jubatus TaxID=34886 RepID=UPI001016FE1B|nr:endogenous retrovirus group K member 7 Pro protein-like [Eumetopias jubatus]